MNFSWLIWTPKIGIITINIQTMYLFVYEPGMSMSTQVLDQETDYQLQIRNFN